MKIDKARRIAKLWLGNPQTFNDDSRIEKFTKELATVKEKKDYDKAMSEMSIWQGVENIKRQEQQVYKEIIEDLVKDYENRFGSRLYK